MSGGAWVASAAGLVGLLGGMHLVMLFLSPRLRPSDPAVVEAMSRATVPLSQATTLWRLWLGFNVSHGLGALGFAATYGYLALREPDVVFATPVLPSVGLTYLLALGWTSLRYWFLTPTLGIAVAALLFAVGLVVGPTS